MKFKDSNLHWCVIAPIITIVGFTMFSIFNIAIVYNTKQPWMSKTYANNICIGIGTLIFIAVVCMFVPIPYSLFAHQYKLETVLPYVTEGVQNKVYAEQDKLWKVLQPLQNRNLGKQQLQLRCCDFERKKTCTPPFIIGRHLHILLMQESRSRIMQIQESGDPIASFFPLIYVLQGRAMLVQQIDHSIDNVDDYRDQIHNLDCHLQRLGLFIYDIHAGNLMVDQIGQLKVIDHDLVLTKAEHKLKQLGQKVTRKRNIQLLGSTNILTSQ